MIRITKKVPNPIPIGATVLLSSEVEVFQDQAFNAVQAKELLSCRDRGLIAIEHAPDPIPEQVTPEQQPTELPPPPSVPNIPPPSTETEQPPIVLSGTASADTGAGAG